ncbi:MAG: alpha/beta hydrolase, partial [Actinomycetia bacterium]|nr:alpha/beta hydrolase [Actinomycetes bacterium]
MRKVAGPASGRCAVILPGSASTSDFAARALGPALAALGLATVSADPAALGDPDAQLAALEAAVGEWDPVLVGGVSLGAHLAARWAAGRSPGRVGGLLLVLPAWT